MWLLNNNYIVSDIKINTGNKEMNNEIYMKSKSIMKENGIDEFFIEII
jgi:hypothetical protein